MHFLEELSEEHTEEIHEEDEKGTLVVLAAFIILCVGALVKQFCVWSKFPYSPCLMVIGLIFGLIAENFGALGESWEYISGIHPHLLLVALLPPLIFESSFSMSFHIFKKEFWQILLLAGPGILINAVLTAVCMRFVFQYIDEFPFDYAFLFGAIMAATDPVAVVALLKELGASKTLSHLIEGESLLNDGTALVLFELLKEIVEGKSVTAGHVIWFFCRLSFGGPILGILFAIASSYWIGKLFRNELLEMVIIFITPYLCFYTAEQSGLQVSGVLALVSLGLYMANTGKTAISKESFHSIHTLWSFAGYAAETIIFSLAGIIIGVKISDLDVELKDWLIIPALYIAVHIIRIFIIALFYPLLKRGYGMNWKKAAVLSYGGLRGAVGLAMALNVYIQYELRKEARDRVIIFYFFILFRFFFLLQVQLAQLFEVTFIKLYIFLVNGTTTGWLINKLGLSKKNYEQLAIYNQLVEHLIESTEGVIEKTLKHNRFLNVVNWDKVKALAITDSYIKNIMQYTISEGKKIKCFDIQRDQNNIKFINQLNNSFEFTLNINDHHLVEQARNRYLTILKGVYWQQFEEGQLSGVNAIHLIEQTENSIDHFQKEIKDWDILEKTFLRTLSLDFVFLLSKIHILSCFSKLFNTYILRHVIKSYQIASNYIIANEQSQELLKEFNFPQEIYQKIKSESNVNIEKASKYLNDYLLLNFKSLIMQIQNHQGAMAVLNYQLNFIEHSYHTGCLNDSEYQKFKAAIEIRMIEMHQLQSQEASDQSIPDPQEVVLNVPFFKLYFNDDERKDIISKIGTPVMYQKGENLYSEGDIITNLYLVCDGSVREYNSENNKIFYFGYIIGIMYLLGNPKSVTSKNKLQMHVLLRLLHKQFKCLQQLVKNIFPLQLEYLFIKIKQQIFFLWKDIFCDFIKFYPKKFKKIYKKPQNKILDIFSQTTYIELDEGDTFEIKDGCFFLQGIIQIGEKQNEDSESSSNNSNDQLQQYHGKIVHAPGYFITDENIICKSDCKILLFNEQAKNLREKLISKKKSSKEEIMKLARLQSNRSSTKWYSKKLAPTSKKIQLSKQFSKQIDPSTINKKFYSKALQPPTFIQTNSIYQQGEIIQEKQPLNYKSAMVQPFDVQIDVGKNQESNRILTINDEEEFEKDKLIPDEEKGIFSITFNNQTKK